eukprot:12965904-Alexandrium_andersonii.AAC.1
MVPEARELPQGHEVGARHRTSRFLGPPPSRLVGVGGRPQGPGPRRSRTPRPGGPLGPPAPLHREHGRSFSPTEPMPQWQGR